MKNLLLLSLLLTATAVSAKSVPTVKGKVVVDEDAAIDLTGYQIEVLHTCRESMNGGTISREVSREIVSAPINEKDGSFIIKKHAVDCPKFSNYRKFYVTLVGPQGFISTDIGGDISVLNNVYSREFSKRNLILRVYRGTDGRLGSYSQN